MKKIFDFVVYWMVILIPFSIALGSAPMNVFMGLLIFSFIMKKILNKEKLFVKTPVSIPLLLLFIITCLSVFNSINYADSMKGGILRLLRYIFIFFIVAQEIKDKKQINKIILFMSLGIVITFLDEVCQVFFGKDFLRGYLPMISMDLVRATASFKDPNTLGIYLSAITPLILGLTLFYFGGKKKIAMFLLSLIALIGIALTYSRPTLLAVYLALLFMGIVKKNRILISVLIAATLIAPFIAPKSIKDWAKQVEYNPVRFMCNDDRIAIYQNSLNMIKDHPIIGLGVNTFMKNYKKYKIGPQYRDAATSDYMYAHNNFLHMAAEIGLLGFGIFLWFLYKLFRQGINNYRRLLDDYYLKVVSLSLLACLIAFLVNGLTESSLYSSRVAVIFWYLAGFTLALGRFIDANRPQNN